MITVASSLQSEYASCRLPGHMDSKTFLHRNPAVLNNGAS